MLKNKGECLKIKKNGRRRPRASRIRGASGKKFRNEGKNWEKLLKKGRQNFLEVICKNSIETKEKLEKRPKKVVRNLWR